MQLPDVHDEQHYPPSDFTIFSRRDIQRACLRTWQGLSQLRPVQPCWQGDRQHDHHQHDHHHHSNMVIILIKMIRVREAGGRVEQSANWQSSLTTWEKARSGNHHFDHDHHMQIQIGWWWSSWWQRQSSTKDIACSMMMATIMTSKSWWLNIWMRPKDDPNAKLSDYNAGTKFRDLASFYLSQSQDQGSGSTRINKCQLNIVFAILIVSLISIWI